MHTNLLCACWHLEAMKGSSSLTSCRLLILSRLLSSLIWVQLTLLACSCLGDPVPPSPKWCPRSQGPRTLPYRDPEQVLCCVIVLYYFCMLAIICSLHLKYKLNISKMKPIQLGPAGCSRPRAIETGSILAPPVTLECQ